MRAVDFGMDQTQSGPARELWANVRFCQKADMAIVLRHVAMSATDPKRTSAAQDCCSATWPWTPFCRMAGFGRASHN